MSMKWLRPSTTQKDDRYGSAPVPHYYRIKEFLTEQMESGLLRFGDQIPTEEQLSERFQVSRMTARRAVNELVSEGRLVRRQGVGTFVQAPRIHRQLTKLTTLTEELKQLGYHGVKSHFLVWQSFKAQRVMAEIFGISVGDPVLRIKRVRYAEKLPIAVQTIDIPVKHVGDLQTSDLEKEVSVYDLAAEHLGSEVEWAKQRIDAVSASQAYAKWLEVPPNSPLFKVTRQTYLSDGQPLDFVRTYYRPDRYSFQVNLYRDRG